MELSRQQLIGLDVSKAWLDGYLPATGRRLRVSNDPAGIAELLQSLADPSGYLVVMEASGGYERTAHREFVARGVPGRDRQPETGARLRPRHGAGGEDRPGRCPADRALWRGDAPAATPVPDPARAELREILACRRQLIDEITVRRQQLEHLRSPAMRGRVDQGPAFLRQEAKELDQLLRQTIRAHRPWPPMPPC